MSSSQCVKPDVVPGQGPLNVKYDIEPLDNKSSTSDYVFYFIDIVSSIVAISLAMIVTTNQVLYLRLIHVIAAIMFRYFYLGFVLILLVQSKMSKSN